MANYAVNLLKNRPILSEREYQRERQIFLVSIVSAILVAVVVVALTAWNLILSRRIAGAQAEITKANTEMQDLATASASQIYLKSRLKLITSYLTDRSTIRESLQRVLNTGVAGTYVNSASFVDEQILEVQVTAETSADLRELLAYYEDKNTYFTQVVSRGIVRTREGNYQVTLELSVPKGGS